MKLKKIARPLRPPFRSSTGKLHLQSMLFKKLGYAHIFTLLVI